MAGLVAGLSPGYAGVMSKRTVTVHDRMQRGYRYALTEPTGRKLRSGVQARADAGARCSALGVFGGKYMTDCRKEFPKSWFARAKLAPKGATSR